MPGNVYRTQSHLEYAFCDDFLIGCIFDGILFRLEKFVKQSIRDCLCRSE